MQKTQRSSSFFISLSFRFTKLLPLLPSEAKTDAKPEGKLIAGYVFLRYTLCKNMSYADKSHIRIQSARQPNAGTQTIVELIAQREEGYCFSVVLSPNHSNIAL